MKNYGDTLNNCNDDIENVNDTISSSETQVFNGATLPQVKMNIILFICIVEILQIQKFNILFLIYIMSITL